MEALGRFVRQYFLQNQEPLLEWEQEHSLKQRLQQSMEISIYKFHLLLNSQYCPIS
jgi:hypothetical protein